MKGLKNVSKMPLHLQKNAVFQLLLDLHLHLVALVVEQHTMKKSYTTLLKMV